jgi:hypothetical protein
VIERTGEAGILPVRPEKTAASSYGDTPNTAHRPLRALDHASLGWAYAFESMGFNILTVITTSALESVDEDCFSGLFGLWAQNRARVRQWMPRLEVIVIVEQGRN